MASMTRSHAILLGVEAGVLALVSIWFVADGTFAGRGMMWSMDFTRPALLVLWLIFVGHAALSSMLVRRSNASRAFDEPELAAEPARGLAALARPHATSFAISSFLVIGGGVGWVLLDP